MVLAAFGVLHFLLAGTAWAQQSSEQVFYNGKIVTVDDAGFTSQLGTIAEAIHVRDGRILQVGTSEQIRAGAGAQTQLINLNGRTVLPGFILTHEHPWDWNPVEPPVVKSVLNDGNVVARFLEGSPEENLRSFPGVLAEAVRSAKPGQWIYIVFTYGKHYEYAPWGTGRFGRKGLDPNSFDPVGEGQITKAQLDAAAPDNPVVLRDVFVSMLLNQRAVEESLKVFPQPNINPVQEDTGLGASFRWMFQDVVMKDHYPELVELMRRGLEWWAGYGMTTFASNTYDPLNVKVYSELDQKGRMPVRQMWTWNWREEDFLTDPYFLSAIVSFKGSGSDHFWFGGGGVTQGGRCTTARHLASSRLAKQEDLQELKRARETQCTFAPGSENAQLLYKYIQAGGRFANYHMIGDRDIDSVMEIILRASLDAGMTEEEVRAKRHSFDHSVMFPRPDQMGLIKRLGIITSGTPFEIYLGSPAVLDLYGERAVTWVVPKKRLVEAGVYSSLELDHAIGSSDLTVFSGLYWMITRKAWDGKVYAPDQTVDRETALKIATTWGSYYVLRDDVLGSLEPGKWADFIVLDKDYLTVPVEEIADLRVLMTVMGGKVVHLVPSLAGELGMQPTGAQVSLGGAAANW
jgi:predicted amidohydrolase YtcJ